MIHVIKPKNFHHKNLESSKNVLKERQAKEEDVKDFSKKLLNRIKYLK